MLKLVFDREPFWLDLLPGARVQFRPMTVAAVLLARTSAADVLRAGGEDAMVKAGVAFTRSLAHSGIAAWEGIGDADGKAASSPPPMRRRRSGVPGTSSDAWRRMRMTPWAGRSRASSTARRSRSG